MLKRHRWKVIAFLLIILALIIANNRYEVIALHPFASNGDADIKVFCLNIHSTGEDFEGRSSKILSVVFAENPDFVYLTEYHDTCSLALDSLLWQRYPYSQRGIKGNYAQTECVYSKWMIDRVVDIHIDIDSPKAQRYVQENPTIKEHMTHSAILKYHLRKDNEKVTIYTCHLTSNNYMMDVDSTQYSWPTMLRAHEQRLRAYEYGSKLRELEIESICKDMANENGTVLLMGDMNDFSASTCLMLLRKLGMKNAWLEGGFGYGSTYKDGMFGLRIDHIYYNDKSELTGVKVMDADMSDHNALVGGFRLR